MQIKQFLIVILIGGLLATGLVATICIMADKAIETGDPYYIKWVVVLLIIGYLFRLFLKPSKDENTNR